MEPTATGEPSTTDATPAAGVLGRRIDPLGSWRRHWWLALATLLAVVALGMPAAWVKGRATYYTEAAVRVSPQFAKILDDDEELKVPSYQQYRQFVEQQVRTIVRYDVASDALARLGAQRALWQEEGETDRHAAERLMAALKVHAIKDTYLITVGLEGRDPNGLAEVINAVVDAYIAGELAEELFGVDQRVKDLERRRQELARTLDDEVADLARLSQQLGVTTFSASLPNANDRLLADREQALVAARQRRVDAEAKLAALDAAHRREGSVSVDGAALAMVAQDAGLNTTKSVLYERRAKLLEQLAGLTEAHPGRPAVESQLRDIDAELAEASQATLGGMRTMLTAKRDSDHAAERSRLQAAVDETVQIETAETAEVEALRQRVAAYAGNYQAALTLRGQIDRDRKQLDRVADRVGFLTLEARSPGFVRIASPALPPEAPVSGGRKNLALLVVGLGLLLGAAAPLGLEVLDPRIRAPADLAKLLGFAPVGWTVERCGGAVARLADDQLRRLALAVERERQRHGSCCFVVTGVRAAGGTTTLALDLAVALDRIGVRSLAVDVNATHADPRYGTSPGVSAVLRDAVDIEQAVVQATATLPRRVPLGSVDDGAPLASLERLRVALASWRTVADVVLLDAPPILAAADAELLAQTAGAVLLVVPSGRVLGAEVQRAARQIERLTPSVVGVVLTRVRSNDGRVAMPPPATRRRADDRVRSPGRLGRTLWSEERS